MSLLTSMCVAKQFCLEAICIFQQTYKQILFVLLLFIYCRLAAEVIIPLPKSNIS